MAGFYETASGAPPVQSFVDNLSAAEVVGCTDRSCPDIRESQRRATERSCPDIRECQRRGTEQSCLDIRESPRQGDPAPDHARASPQANAFQLARVSPHDPDNRVPYAESVPRDEATLRGGLIKLHTAARNARLRRAPWARAPAQLPASRVDNQRMRKPQPRPTSVSPRLSIALALYLHAVYLIEV
jgi:hypothetical protein